MSVRVVRGNDDDEATNSNASPTTSSSFAGTARRIEAERWHARVEGEAVVAEARKRAEAIAKEAEKQAESLRERARAEGLDEGRRQAIALVARARAEEAATTERSIAIVVDAARAVAERAVGAAIANDAETFASWARQALVSLRGARRIFVRGNSSSIDRLNAHIGRLAPDGGSIVELVVDPSLVDGVLVARSDLGEVRLEVSMQIAAMIDVVREAIARSIRSARG